MHENKNEQNTGTKTIKKIGKVTYEAYLLCAFLGFVTEKYSYNFKK